MSLVKKFLDNKVDTYNSLIDSLYSDSGLSVAINGINGVIKPEGVASISRNITNIGTQGISAIPGLKDLSEKTESTVNIIGEKTAEVTKSAVRNIKNITEYAVPTSLTQGLFDEIGSEIDSLISASFEIQAFGLKGTDILCSTFCVLISFLSCSERNKLYESIRATQAITTGISKGVQAANGFINITGAAISSADNLISSFNSIFSSNGIVEGGLSAITTIASAIPSSIKNTISTINKALKTIKDAKISVPILRVGDKVWDFAENALYSLLNIVVSAADELFNKIIAPLEDLIRKMQPVNCSGFMSAKFFNRIISTVIHYKQWLLRLIADIFTQTKAFSLDFKDFNFQIKQLLEIEAFIEGLNLCLGRFGDLAIACGVQPCYEGNTDTFSNNARAGIKLPETDGIAETINTTYKANKANNINELAEKISTIISVDAEDVIVTDKDIKTIYNYNNIPSKIADFIKSGVLAKELGPEYSIYNEDNSITVVHKFIRMC